MTTHRLAVLLFILAATASGIAQQDKESTVSCSFADGKQISVRYLRPDSKGKEPFGKIVPWGHEWKPGGQPILLFTTADVTLDSVNIPVGAYELYPVPDEEQWKLIIKRPVAKSEGSPSAQQIGSVTLGAGKLGQPLTRFTIYLGHVAERQCNMRMYWGHTGVWAEFKEAQKQ